MATALPVVYEYSSEHNGVPNLCRLFVMCWTTLGAPSSNEGNPSRFVKPIADKWAMRRTCTNRCRSGSCSTLPLASAPLPLCPYRVGACTRGIRRTSKAPASTARPTSTACSGSIELTSSYPFVYPSFWFKNKRWARVNTGGRRSKKQARINAAFGFHVSSLEREGMNGGAMLVWQSVRCAGGRGARGVPGAVGRSHHYHHCRKVTNQAGTLPAPCPAASRSKVLSVWRGGSTWMSLGSPSCPPLSTLQSLCPPRSAAACGGML